MFHKLLKTNIGGHFYNLINPFPSKWVLRALIDFTLSNARRFYSSMGNLLDRKGLKPFLWQLYMFHKNRIEQNTIFLILKGCCILSPLLFNLYTNNLPYLFKNTMSDPFVLPKGTKKNTLLYADDFILSRSKTGLQNCLNARVYLQIGWTWTLKVNPKKTKIIFQKHPRKSGDTNFKIGTEPIEIFQEFTYLCTRSSYNSEVWGWTLNRISKKGTIPQ